MQTRETSLIRRTLDNLREFRRLRSSSGQPDQMGAASFPVFVINLERSPERRQYAVAHLSSVGLSPTVFTAVDGKQLNLPDLVERGIYDDARARESFARSLSLAEIGCSLSHVGVCRHIVSQQLDFALVAEDDVHLPPSASEEIRRIIEGAPADWGLIQLKFFSRRFVEDTAGFVNFPYDNGLPVGATAYLVRLSAAEKICAHAFPIRYPADSMLGRAAQWDVRIYGVCPQLAGVNNVFPSSIQGARNWRFRLSNFAKTLLLKAMR
jgi:glycosyl transferase family 25